MLSRIRIILVNTSHPGNIGSAARAMKTMGLNELFLVTPQLFPHPKALEMASGAQDILERAQLCSTLHEAIADCSFVIGTSARMRTIPWPIVEPREMAAKVLQAPADSKVALLFGREQTGLTNEELHHCHLHVRIPVDEHYSSLNIAHAVQVIAYELRLASREQKLCTDEWDYRSATMDEMEKFFTHLQEVVIAIDFLKMNAPRQLMTRFRRFFLRARPDAMEVNIFRGMLTAIQESLAKK